MTNNESTPKIELTLDPMGSAAAAQAPAAAPTAPAAPAPTIAAAEKTVAAPFDEANFTPEERRMIDDFSEKIDITDSTTILGFGASAQKKIADFSDTALNGVRNKDFSEVGTMITNLIGQLKDMNAEADESDKGFLGIFTGGLKATAGGITAAIFAGLLASLLFRPKDKS